MTMGPQPTLETERLILRPFRLNDAKTVQRLAGRREIASTTLNVPHPYEDGVAEDWINKHESTYHEGKGVTFAVTLKTDGELIGAVTLMNMSKSNHAELAYWVGVPYWNQGYCTEACEEILLYGFMELELNRIHACFFSRNPSSGRVLEKLGMAHEGTLREHTLKWGVYEDLELMGILRSGWERSMNTKKDG
jgi:RimJ/RimL family protein N-acetyltransferase